MKIISIDPGFERIGIAIIEKKISSKEKLLYSDCFKTSPRINLNERIYLIGKEIESKIKEYKPDIMAIEKLYLTTNEKTVMGVAEARGVIIYEATRNKLRVCEYTPPEIKIAVTGYGKADKKMVMSMVPKLIEIKDYINSDDELDAIAIGLTCIARERLNFKGNLD